MHAVYRKQFKVYNNTEKQMFVTLPSTKLLRVKPAMLTYSARRSQVKSKAIEESNDLYM